MPTSNSCAGLEQHGVPGTLWLVAELLQASEHFKQKGEQHPRGNRGGSRGKSQNSVARLSIQRCSGALALEQR